MNLEILLNDFFTVLAKEQIEVYNEFSLQHEMGIYLRERLPEYKVQFERNARFFRIFGTIKHEIDIVVFNEFERYAIELKYPVHGQYPEEMFAFIKDLKFMEEIKQAGFNGTYCITLVDDKNFYSGNKRDGIYSFFRGNKAITGTIEKPTGQRKEQISICNSYLVNWKDCGKRKFYMIKI